MKKVINTLVVIGFICFLTACKKENYALPPETQTGAGTFGCKINGKVWVPRGSDGYSGQNIKAFYQLIYPSSIGYVFNISATNYDKNPIESISLGSDSIQLYEGMVLNLKSGFRFLSGAGRFMKVGYTGTVKFQTNETNYGELHLTKFDTQNRIASGVFWFDAINENGELIQITEGRFDVKFTR